MKLAVEQLRERLRAQLACNEVGSALPEITDAAWPAARVAGVSLGEAPAHLARARREEIRTKWLRFLDSDSGKQQQDGAGESVTISGMGDRSSDAILGRKRALYVLDMFSSRAGFSGAIRIRSKENARGVVTHNAARQPQTY